MNIGIVLPGFSGDIDDWAIPVQRNLIREMAKEHNVRVITLRYPHRRDTYDFEGATIHSLGVGAWTRGFKRLKLWYDAIRIIKQLHQQRPFHVLHAMWADETGLIAGWAGKQLGIPVVVSIAGGELVGFDDIEYGLQRSRFSRWTVGQALKHASAIVVACNYVKHLVTQSNYTIPPERIRMTSLGVDTQVFTPQPDLRHPNHLIHVASLISVKDQTTLLKAVALVEDASLDIIGEGSDESNLRQLVSDLHINHRVNFIGAVHHLELPTYYNRAQLNLLSSRHEGLGMVTLEAGSCGLPTISTNVGLLPDHPELGISVPIGDHYAMANAIRELMHHQEQLDKLRNSAHTLTLDRFTIQHTIAHFIKLYHDLQIG